MEKVNDTPLFDPRAAQYIIGCVMHQPSIIYNREKYLMSVDDFSQKIYKILYSAVDTMAINGAESISPIELDVYLSSYKTQYDFYKDNSGQELVQLCYEITEDFDSAQFDLFYNRIKKFSILRDLKNAGFSIKEFYNPDFLNQERTEEKFNALTPQEIINKVRNNIQLIENSNVTRQDSTSQYAAKNVRNLVKELQAMPEVGVEIQGIQLNYATRGCRKGKMYLYSAPSGGGKTRTMVGNACSLAFPYIQNGKIYTPLGLKPVLFVATEMQADEIQTLILSWISGVDEEKILLGCCDEAEQRLINVAIDIMEQYEKNFIIEVIPNPSIQGLKSMLTTYILKENIEYIFYDYIFTSVGLTEEFRSINLREDVVLMMLSNTLKEIAATYNVFVMTGTQLNGTWEGKMVRNANMLRGSKAIADKIDVGMIGVRAPQEELDMVRDYCQKNGYAMPNIVIDIYKNRRGKMCDVKIFRRFNYGTCRTEDVCITTQSSYAIYDNIPVFQYDYTTEDIIEYEHKHQS